MKKFRLNYNVTREFTIPDTATDEEYDMLKATIIDELKLDTTIGNVKVELIDAPDEIKQKYIYNRDCD
jgi:hypothetical protein